MPAAAGKRQRRAQLPVVRVERGIEHRERVRAAGEEDGDEHRLSRAGRPALRDPFLEQAELAEPVDGEREPEGAGDEAAPVEPRARGRGHSRLDRGQPACRPRRRRAGAARRGRTRRSDGRDGSSAGLEVGGSGEQLPQRVLDQSRVLLLLPVRIRVGERALGEARQRGVRSAPVSVGSPRNASRSCDELRRRRSAASRLSALQRRAARIAYARDAPARAEGGRVEPARVVPARDVRRVEELLAGQARSATSTLRCRSRGRAPAAARRHRRPAT